MYRVARIVYLKIYCVTTLRYRLQDSRDSRIYMAGHSKWKQIKHKKAANDQQRAKIFSKISKLITSAVIEGGGFSDPNINVKLRLAIDKAKNANMPKDNIARAIEKGSGPDRVHLKEVLYEGFGPHGVALVVHATTDNSNRTVVEVRSVIEKAGGKLGVQGSVSYLFQVCHNPELEYTPLFNVEITESAVSEQIIKLLEQLEELDDVQQVFTNAVFPE